MFSIKNSTHGGKKLWAVFIGEKQVAGPYGSEQEAVSRAEQLGAEHNERTTTAREYHRMFDIFINKAPLTVGQFLDLEFPTRHALPEVQQAAGIVMECFQLLVISDSIQIDTPITENSVIHGLTSTGREAHRKITNP